MTMRAPTVAALAGSAHLGPTVVVTAITLGLGIAVGAPPGSVALLTIAMLIGQLSVGWSNDWLDAGLDRRAGRTDKPAADGRIDPRLLRTLALVALIPALLLPFWASVPAGALHVVFVASAWSYNLGLKRTPASVLPYIVSFGSLPALATLLRVPPTWPPAWAIATGAALGVAAHFANVLPDIETDRAEGSRGLPQLLGARTSGVAASLVVIAAAVLVGVAARPGPVGLIALVLTLAAALTGLVVSLRSRPGRAAFRAVMAAALLLVVTLIASAGAL